MKLCYNMKTLFLKGGGFMDLKRYFTFEGRINRAHYFAASISISLIANILGRISKSSGSLLLLMVYLLFAIAATAVNICIGVQRLHDIERPGTHYWLLLIPLYNLYLALVLLFKKGTDGPNEYGSDPLALNYE